MYPIIFFTIALVLATIHLFISKVPRTKLRALGIYLLYLVVFNIGVQGIFAFMGHTFMADQIARQIGWPVGSPFQFEVAVANLAFGVLGILCIWFGSTFKLATVLGSSVFIFGAAYGHFVQMAKGDYSPYNSGIFLWAGDIIIPAIILVLMLMYYVKAKKHRKSSKQE